MQDKTPVSSAHMVLVSREIQMEHHSKCSDFRGMDPGFSHTGDQFIEKYSDRFLQFPISACKECLGCCLAYLTMDRKYTRLEHYDQPGLFYVHFPIGYPLDLYRIPSVTSFARIPLGPSGVNGQIATGQDPNFGIPFCQSLQASRTYQLYVPYVEGAPDARGLSIGFPCTARMESVAIDVVDQDHRRDIADIKLNFADAMLVERYKEMSGNVKVRGPFQGCCMTPHVDALADGMQKVTINK